MRCILLDLIYRDTSDRSELEAEVDLHNILQSVMWLRYEQIEEEDTQELATLAACCLLGMSQAKRGINREGKEEDRLEDER